MKWYKNPRYRLRLAWALFWGSLIGWPVSIFLTDEPVFILSLSWLAINLTAFDVICTSDLRANQK